jgi:uncharacterized protein with GYD domain
MPKYMFKVSYSATGLQGVLGEGGTSREEAARSTVESVGGSLECLYFAFGDVDVYLMADFPDAASAAAVAMTVSATDALSIETVALLEPSEVDEAVGKSVDYRAPGA